MEELLASVYQITTFGSTSYQADFEHANSGIFQELWLSKFYDKNKSLIKTLAEASQIVLHSTFTLYVDYNSARNMEEYKDCKLIGTNIFVRKTQKAFAFPKHSPYLSVINARLQAMFESGEVLRIIKKHSDGNPTCHSSKGMSLGFENIAIVFFILAVGLSASILLCFMEWILNRNSEGVYFALLPS